MIKDVTKGSISRHLIRLTIPTIGGFIAITAFNLSDTFFVAKLGTDALAAMGFTFPIVMITGALASGLSMGAGSVLARAMGEGNEKIKKHTATYGILLALVVVAIVGIGGIFSMDFLFKAFGAEGHTLRLVKEYMFIWYLGSVAVVMPPVGDACLRATGDMIRPFIVMTVCAVMNIILDPLLIFGVGIFPEMGIRGASLATVISRIFGMCFTLYFNYKAGHLDLSRPGISNIWSAWKNILSVGVPSVLTQILPPAIRAVLTSLAAISAGTVGVAALAVGSRIESFPMIIALSVNSAILTVIGQNWGRQEWERVEQTRKATVKMALLYGLFIFIVFWPLAAWAGRVFTNDTQVLKLTILYLRIIFAGYTGMVLFSWTAIGLNAIGKPKWSLILNISCTLLFLIPGALAGHFAGGFQGMITGLMIGQLLSGVTAYIIGRFQFTKIQ